MTQTPRETYLDMIEALEAGDEERFVARCSPQAEYRALIGLGSHYEGHDGIRRYLRDLRDAFGEFLPGPTQVVEQGDWVFAEGQSRAVGGGSGIGLEWRFFQIARFRDGLFEWGVAARTREEALAAAGVERWPD